MFWIKFFTQPPDPCKNNFHTLFFLLPIDGSYIPSPETVLPKDFLDNSSLNVSHSDCPLQNNLIQSSLDQVQERT